MKKFLKVIKIIFQKVAMLLCIIIPFLNKCIDNAVGKKVWFISAAIFIIFEIIDWSLRHKAKNEKKALDFFSRGSAIITLAVFGSVFAINYYDTNYNWWWAIAVCIFIITPIEVKNFHDFLNSKKEKQQQSEPWTSNMFKQIAFGWIIGLFYVSCFNSCIWFQFAFGLIVVIAVFYNISSVLINREVKKWLLLFDFFVGVSVSIYLIYLIPNTELRNIILTITAALYGGLLTLVGVAWTIVDGKKRERETKRLECMPFLQLEIPQQNVDPSFEIALSLCKGEATDTIYKILTLRNLGNGTATNLVYSWEVSDQNITGNWYPPINAIMKGDQYTFLLTLDTDEYTPSDCKPKLVFEFNDLLGHTYEQKVYLEVEDYEVVCCENDIPRFLGEVRYQVSDK